MPRLRRPGRAQRHQEGGRPPKQRRPGERHAAGRLLLRARRGGGRGCGHAVLKAAADAALLIEYGNEARPAGGKTAYTTFVRVLRKGKAGSDIKRVSFNINPSFDRPTATVDRANDPKLGFAFEYAMAWRASTPASCASSLRRGLR